MTSYLGFDVLEHRPNMREAVTDVSPDPWPSTIRAWAPGM